MPRLHSGAANDIPETNNTTHPPIPEVVWQQPQETCLKIIHKNPYIKFHKNIHMAEFKQKLHLNHKRHQ